METCRILAELINGDRCTHIGWIEDALKIVNARTFESNFVNTQVRTQSFGRDVLVRCPLTLGQTAGAMFHLFSNGP